MQRESGVIYAVLAYCLWGFLPIYWKLIGHVSSDEILAHRVIWSFAFSIFFLLVINGWHQFLNTTRSLKKDLKQMVIIFTASMIITTNWFIYIWAVNSGHVTDASLGYYINPLVSVLLGVVFLKSD